MSQIALDFLEKLNLSPELTIFIISAMPVLELRGGLIAASILKVPVLRAFVICFLGNILPLPFILLFIKKIFELMKKVPIFKDLVGWLERRAEKKSEDVKKRQYIGLFIFALIPLPGTGGWTSSLIASLLNMPVKKSLLAITAGVFCAGLIMIVLTYFIPGLFGF